MASAAPGQAYVTKFTVLSGTGNHDVLTVGADGEKGANLVGVTIVDSTGSVATQATVVIRRSTTNYALHSALNGLPTSTENLEIVCEPVIRLKVGDIIRVVGATNHVAFVSYVPIGIDPGAAAQA